MDDYSGTLQSFAVANSLGLVPLPALVAALVITVTGVPSRSEDRKRPARAAWICAAAAVSSVLLTAYHVVELAQLPDAHRYLSCHLSLALRIGSLDASLAFALDPLGAPLLLAVSAIGAATLLAFAFEARQKPPPARVLAASSLLLAATQALLLGSGFFTFLLASSVAAVATVALLGRGAASAAPAIAQVSLLGAAALLFWSYGGGWHDEKYAPALRPRVVAVEMAAPAGEAPAAPALKSGGQLSLRALAGTRLGLGAAELCAVDAAGRPGGVGLSARPCREPAQSPFSRLPVPAAIHDFHLFPGDSTNELEVEKVRIRSGRETLLVLLGPTLDFRELADQLSLQKAGENTVRRTLQRAELFGLPALSIALFLVVLAAAINSDRFPRVCSGAVRHSPPSVVAMVCGLATVAGVYLLGRLDFLLGLTPRIAAVGVVLGAAILVRAAARALVERSFERASLFLAIAQGGLAFGGVAGGAAASGIVYLAIAASAASAFALTAGNVGVHSRKPGGGDGSGDRARWLGALALSAAPLPALAKMLGRVSAEEGARSLPGAVVLALLAAGAGLISYAVWGNYYRGLHTVGKDRGRSVRQDSCVKIGGLLAALTLAFGIFAGTAEGFEKSKIAWVASFAFPLYGWAAARRRYAGRSDQAVVLPALAWLGAAPRGRALIRIAGSWVDFAGNTLSRLEQLLYAPLSWKKSAERSKGDP